jgi:hypothetical protein
MAKTKNQQFVWLAAPGDWGGGKAKLETGKVYEATSFPDDVVAGWVRDGAAKWSTAEEK